MFQRSYGVNALLICQLCCSYSVFSTENLTQTPITIVPEATSFIDSTGAKQKLISKLSLINYFSADFEQKIIDATGNLLQTGGGTLSVSKPNLVYWDTKTPEPSLIVSDGSSLWFYDPFIEQVSAYNLDGAIVNTPILLLTNDSPSLWQHYDVSEVNESTFLIHANDPNSRIKTLELHFKEMPRKTHSEDLLSGFTFLDATGQLSVITLQNVDNENAPDPQLFRFSIPEGVHLDDQR